MSLLAQVNGMGCVGRSLMARAPDFDTFVPISQEFDAEFLKEQWVSGLSAFAL